LASGPANIVKLVQKPRCVPGIDSAIIRIAPVASPPTAMPCTIRSSTSSSGAAMPIDA